MDGSRHGGCPCCGCGWDATLHIIERAVARKHPSPLSHFATEEPLLARRAGTARQAAVVARLGVRSFGIFERHEPDQLAILTATIAMRQMGSQYQPDAPARETTSIYSATEEPLLARRAGTARQAAVVARLGVRSFGIFERHEPDQLAILTIANAMRQMGSQYQPDAPARETTSIIPPPKNPCWRDGLVMHGNPRLSQLDCR